MVRQTLIYYGQGTYFFALAGPRLASASVVAALWRSGIWPHACEAKR